MDKTCIPFALLLIFLTSLMRCSANAVANFTTDQFALLSLKAHITDDPYNILAKNWSIATTTSICNWIGVSCGVRHQRVTALNLSDMGLTGSIAPHLGNLTFLVSLDISNNNFYGFITQELAHSRRLIDIRLYNNNLTGEVPSWFGTLAQLQHLYLYGNNFRGTIPTSVCNMSKLETFSLAYNSLYGQIPQQIGNLSNLRMLDFKYNRLSGFIPYVIFKMSSLRILDLTNNSLSDSLPVDMCNHISELEELYLSVNQLHGQIPSNIYKCRGLQYLSLSFNEFYGSIPREIGNLTMLKHLFLGANSFKGTLPEEIGNLKLEMLDVFQNRIDGLIPPIIFNISTLKILQLNFNHFSGHLQSSVGFFLPNLVELYLGNNDLTGIIPVSLSNASKLTVLDMAKNSLTGFIPDTLGNLRFIKRLLLGENNFTTESSTPELSFFSSLTNCRELEMIIISLNNLNGILPSSIGNLSTTLQWFDAFSCHIKGNIPVEIGNLSSLRVLALDNNELNGSIPTTIGALKNLEGVYLEHNRLQGSIPHDFCRLKFMSKLYLSDNDLNGSIPPCLGELTSLKWLFLESNKLTSTIPSALWNLQDLLCLNLSSNLLTGNLSSNIENLKAISQIALSWNQLSGDIPSSIGDVVMVTSLSLAHNKFEGSIPESLGKLVSLEYLDLSNNEFSGVIPKSLEELRYLNYFNVSCNRLEGEIPNEGRFANFTAQSYMENDALCGAPRLHVQLCKTKTHRNLESKVAPLLKYILPSIAATVLVVSLIIVWIMRRESNLKLVTQEDSIPLSWRKISYHEIFQATDAFSESNLLGMGSVGSVYKGTLLDGMNVAVKVFNLTSERDFKSFDVECDVMRNVRHRNLIKIISSCTNLDFKALVLEYMPKGSLEMWLYSHNYCLDILQRLNISIDVASAMEYLHHGHTTPIVHCDLKPNNVVLDEDMVAHVCDFGISKLLGEKEFMAQTKTLATIGYMAPEYGMEGIVSTSCDVYSYGILLMETFTRKKPTDEMFSGEVSLRSWVNSASGGSVIQVVDNNLIGREDEQFSAKEECVSSILDLALNCSTTSPGERISMEEVVVRLKKIKITLLANIQNQSRQRGRS